jgi:ribose transport system substrate-binding protein
MRFKKIMTAALMSSVGAIATQATADDTNIAYLSASSANTWLAASLAEMETVAAANGMTITEFDAQFDPAKQATQIQDVIASGQYDGMVIVALSGAGVAPDVEAAIAEGMKVVVMNQVAGADLTTSDPQIPGVSASVMAAPQRSGERLGMLTVQACEGIDPCEIVYIFGIRGIPLDNALRAGFDAVIADHSNIKVVAEGEGKYLGPEQGMTATQDILQVQPSFDVMVGPDQAIQGAQIVLEDEGMINEVKLIGSGGSASAIDAIAEGTWFGGLFGAPATEGRLAMEAMVDALNNDNNQGGIDPLADLPDGGLMTQSNVGNFTAEWGG